MTNKKLAGNSENPLKISSNNSVLSNAQHTRNESSVNENTYQQFEKRLYTWSEARSATLKREQ
jgi:predicted secreted protein